MDSLVIRKKILINFFKEIGFNIEIYGTVENPSIIVNKKKILNCYQNAWNLVIYRDAVSREIIKLVDIRETPDKELEAWLRNWILNDQHRECWCIVLEENESLRLSGYNFQGKKGEYDSMYPVFSQIGYKYYFKREKAEIIVDRFSTKTLPLKII